MLPLQIRCALFGFTMWVFLRWNRRVEKVLILLGFLYARNIQKDIDSHWICSHWHVCTIRYTIKQQLLSVNIMRAQYAPRVKGGARQ